MSEVASNVVSIERPKPLGLPTTGDVEQWTDDQKALLDAAGLVKRPARGPVEPAPRSTVVAFLAHCQRTGLDPIARQIYAIERGGKWTITVSIDGFRLVAQRSGQYAGQTPIEWTADGVTWADVWLADEPPAAARVGVRRRGFEEPLYAVARWKSYAVTVSDWQNGQKVGEKLSPMWERMPDLMLGKVAEALALRRAFPMELSGLYTEEEIDFEISAEPAPRAPRQSKVLEPGTRSAQRDPLPDDPEQFDRAPAGPSGPQVGHGQACKQCNRGNHEGCTGRLYASEDSPDCECSHGEVAEPDPLALTAEEQAEIDAEATS